MATETDDRSLSALVGDLTQQMSTLVQQEMQLARAEMSEQVGRIGTGFRSLALGAAFAFAGLTFVLLAGVIGLALVVPAWLAALFVGFVAANIGSLLLLRGRKALRVVDLTPHKALQSIGRRVQDTAANSRRVA
jgi:hypothetical protein